MFRMHSLPENPKEIGPMDQTPKVVMKYPKCPKRFSFGETNNIKMTAGRLSADFAREDGRFKITSVIKEAS